MSEIITGEAVALELRLAKLPSRLLAGLLDLMLQLLVLYIFTIVTTPVLDSTDPGFAIALYILFLVAIFVGYPVTMETLTRGRTLGKMAMGIRVVRVDGGPVGFRQALVRGLFAGLLEKPGLFFGFTMPLAVVVMLVNAQGRRLGDLTAGTVVLQERVPAPQAAYFAAMPPPLAGWAPTLDLTGLDDGLALAVRQFLSRLHQLDPAARADLGIRLVDAVAAATTPAPPPGTPGWAYLTAVLAERRRREEQRLAARRPAVPSGPPAQYGPPQYGPPQYGPPQYGPPQYGPPQYP
ncbi:MAG: RDD family protein, partial [Actinomycetota bacterium]|nr:RDD family protein [Actinomycetota bacterium]